MKISRKRVQELDQWGVGLVSDYIGPTEFARKFCTEGQPFDWEQGSFNDTSEWIHTRIVLEPDWQIDQDQFGRWVVYDANDRGSWFPKLHARPWNTRERAEAYLKLWQEDWWEDADEIH